MRLQAILLSLISGLALIVLLLLNTVQAGAYQAAAAASPPEEAGLNPAGSAFEINIDSDGYLWISDFGSNEIWQVDSATAAYTIFHGIQAPSDARRDASGFVWWGDGLEGRFGRLDPTSGSANWWAAPGADGLLGSQIDENDDFWAAGYETPYLYHYRPATTQLCTYTLPMSGTAAYPQVQDGSVWLGDEVNGRLLRLNPLAAQYTIWPLPADTAPQGAAFDQYGDLWFTDPNHGHLDRFRSTNDQLESFVLTAGQLPEMITTRGNSVWYSEQWDGAIGQLIPPSATGTTVPLTPTTTVADVTCNMVTPALTRTITTSQGMLNWATQTYPLLVDSGGWLVYDLASGALPWGVVADGDDIWFIDTGRQVLGRIPQDPLSTVTGCKVEDADGNVLTTGDLTAVQDWPIDLLANGVAQGITQTTGADGCTTWTGLNAGPSYGVAEGVLPGWVALSDTSHDFGLAAAGQNYSHTFVNSQSVVVEACKERDGDGSLDTTNDRTPVVGWTVYLTVAGQRQEPGQLTGSDGCYAWTDLAPGSTYGVEEDVPEKWQALTATSHEFEPAVSGASYSFTFVNAREDYLLFLPVIIR